MTDEAYEQQGGSLRDGRGDVFSACALGSWTLGALGVRALGYVP